MWGAQKPYGGGAAIGNGLVAAPLHGGLGAWSFWRRRGCRWRCGRLSRRPAVSWVSGIVLAAAGGVVGVGGVVVRRGGGWCRGLVVRRGGGWCRGCWGVGRLSWRRVVSWLSGGRSSRRRGCRCVVVRRAGGCCRRCRCGGRLRRCGRGRGWSVWGVGCAGAVFALAVRLRRFDRRRGCPVWVRLRRSGRWRGCPVWVRFAQVRSPPWLSLRGQAPQVRSPPWPPLRD